MSVEEAKTWGGVGAILLLISIPLFSAPIAGGVLALLGAVFVLLGFKHLAEYSGREDIWKNALYWFILAVVSDVVLTAGFIVALGVSFTMLPLHGHQALVTMLLTIGIFLFISWVIFVVAAIMFRRAAVAAAQVSGVDTFSTAGTFMLIGAALMIVLIGGLLIFVAYILLTVAFFSLKPKQQPASSTQPTVTVVTQ